MVNTIYANDIHLDANHMLRYYTHNMDETLTASTVFQNENDDYSKYGKSIHFCLFLAVLLFRTEFYRFNGTRAIKTVYSKKEKKQRS